MDTPYFVPIFDLLPYWPHDLVAPADVPALDRLSAYIGVTDFDVIEYDGYLTVVGVLAIWEEVEVKLPLVDGFYLVLGQTGAGVTKIPFELLLGQAGGLEDPAGLLEKALSSFLKGFLPPYELRLHNLDLKLRVDRRYLKPVVPDDADNPENGFHEAPGDARIELALSGGAVSGTVIINTDTGLRLEGFEGINLDYAQIGSSGVVIKAENLLVRFSDAQPLPPNIDPEEIDLPEDWKGVFFRTLKIYNLQKLWERLPHVIELENWYFGTGGVTGEATLVDDLTPEMSDKTLALRAFQLKLEQNTLINALIQVAIKLKFWDDKVVYLDLSVTNDPELDFPESVGLIGAVSLEQPEEAAPVEPGELLALTLSHEETKIFRLGVAKLGVRSTPDRKRADDQDEPPETRFFDLLLDGSARILPPAGVGDAVLGAEVRELGLQLAPTFHLLLPNGLWVEISKELLAKISAFPVRISRIGFGEEGNEKWIGLDARLALGGGTKIGAAVKGLRVFFDGPPGIHLSFEGIELKIVRDPHFSLSGFLSMKSEPDPNSISDSLNYTFSGGVELAMVIGGVGVKIDGFILFGTKSGARFWYVALDAVFGKGIPIFSTGVSWFGAALMLGNNIAPIRTLAGEQGDNFNWYEHWYKPGPGAYSVIHSGKWEPSEDHWALGAGVTIGSPDGQAWSLKALIAVLLPGPIIIVEGRLRLLKTRESHKGPPTSDLIRGLMALDFDEGNFLLALEVNHKLPESGLLFDLHAEGEVFYRAGVANDWHLAIGWYEPISRRVRATGLKLFNWDFYFILSGKDLRIADRTFPGIALAIGYRNGFDKRWKFGPVRVVAAAWFAVDLAMSFKPFYVLGQVGMHGEVAVKAFGFGFELMLDIRLALEAPVNGDDLFFAGEIKVRIGLPWPLPDIKKKIPISFGDAEGLPPPVAPLTDAASVTPGVGSSSSLLYNRETGTTTDVKLPMDGRVVIEFQRPMRSAWAGAPTPVSLARADQVGETFYRYTLSDLRVRVTLPDGSSHDAEEEIFGQWTLSVGDAGGPRADGLILWGTSPFPFAGSLSWPGRTERRSWADYFYRFHNNYPCGDDPPAERCVDFESIPFGEYRPELRSRPDPARTAVIFRPFPGDEGLAALRQLWAEVIQLPVTVVRHISPNQPDQHCLQFAETIGLGSFGSRQELPLVRSRFIQWGLEIELSLSRRASGIVDFDPSSSKVEFKAWKSSLLVASGEITQPDFMIDVGNEMEFNRLTLELFVKSPVTAPVAAVDPKIKPCLLRFCYTPVGLIEGRREAADSRGRWAHVLDPLTDGLPDSEGTRFGAHLIHEPGTTYTINMDIDAEQATDADGPWTVISSTTETLTVGVGGAPEDLTPYLEQFFPADGDRPVYADYDLKVTFNRPYVEAMYDKSGDSLAVDLVDGMGKLIEPAMTRSRTNQPALTPENEVFVERLLDSPCVTVDLTKIVGNDETLYSTRLATSTAYEARIRGGGHANPLHRWSFATSRYRNFAEHIADFRGRPWEEALPAGADWTVIGDRLMTAAGADRGGEFDLFLEVWRDTLGFNLRTLPVKPEVTLLWETAPPTPAVRALSVVSPEPLFTQRTVFQAARRDASSTWIEQPMKFLRSLDGARALLVPVDAAATAAPIPLPAGEYRLEWIYQTSGVAGLPDLSRSGDASSETAVFGFQVTAAPNKLVNSEA